MLFSIGNRVRIKHTGEEGKVVDQIDESTVLVELFSSEMEIPVAIDDLVRSEDYRDTFSKVKAKFVKGKKEQEKPELATPNPEKQYLLLKNRTVELGFEPIYEQDETVRNYRVFLLNVSTYDFLLGIAFKTKNQGTFNNINDKLNALEAKEVGILSADRLSDNPEVNIDLWRLTTAGTGNKLSNSIKIKPKQFFKSIRTAPLLGRRMHLYHVLDPETPQKDSKKNTEEDLKSYTKRKYHSRKPADPDESYYHIRDIEAFANFDNELDLHIERLAGNWARMNAGEILRLQLNHFEDYMNQAIRLGVERVFIIHGIGKGKLRDEIAKRLSKNPYVASFKNEYHHKYGVGATEVIFD